MADFSFMKGFRTNCIYYPESTFGTSQMTTTKVKRVSGKVRSVQWQARQGIIQTGNVGGGRNYTQQLLGAYDANASMNFEVVTFEFLRHAMGDVAKYGVGTAEATPFFLVEAELTGLDGDNTSMTALSASDSISYTKVRIRPFSMMLYDSEAGQDSVEMLKGCMINDFSLTGSINTPVMCNANILVREIEYYRSMPFTPDFTSSTTDATDYGNGNSAVMNPVRSQTLADQPPLMLHQGQVSIYHYTDLAGTTVSTEYVLGQVTQFTYNYNNGLLVYRSIGSRFIELPQTGMRRQTLTCNVVFRLSNAGTDLDKGIPTSSETTILELIKNHFGYTSTATWVTATDPLRPSLASSTGDSAVVSGTTNSAQTVKAIESHQIKLLFKSYDVNGTVRGATLNAHNCTIDGFGHPVQLENGLIEVPITFSIRGYPYVRVSDGSYGGHDGAGTAITDIHPTLVWWNTIA